MVRKRSSSHRIRHILGVETTAGKLAQIYGIDPHKAAKQDCCTIALDLLEKI